MRDLCTYGLIFFCLISCGDGKEPDRSVHPDKPGEIHLSELQVQLGDIGTDTIREREIGREIWLPGSVMPDERHVRVISSRVMGRIERLFIRTDGGEVKEGDPLYEINADDLNTGISEYLLALIKKDELKLAGMDHEKNILASRNKLILYGLTNAQLNEIAEKRAFIPPVTIYSQVSGTVTAVEIREGDYIMEGDVAFRLADFSYLWVEARVDIADLVYMNYDLKATIGFPGTGYPETVAGIISIARQLEESTASVSIRFAVSNAKGLLKPGMQAEIALLIPLGRGLAVPTGAVIMEGKKAFVWVSAGQNLFRRVAVHMGSETGNYTEILHGLAPGDVVVVSGAYLLNSEYTIRGGSDGSKGHQH